MAAQLRALRDHAAKHGYAVAREYVDEAESGRIADRPEFRKLLDAGGRPQAPFQVILVWKFSRFTRKREHAVAFKAMLRRKGIRVVSITEHADDSPTGKLMEAIIESVDEFYSENLAQEVTRGMREAASRGFWVSSRLPYGYARVLVPDGAKQRPKLAVAEPAATMVRRLFTLTDREQSLLDITKTLNAEGIASPNGQRWLKSAVHRVLTNEVYLAYRQTLQADALTLVAKKLQSALAVEGELPEDGLAAYGDDGDDLLLALARQIVSGDEAAQTEPVAAVFAQAQAAAADAEALLVDADWQPVVETEPEVVETTAISANGKGEAAPGVNGDGRHADAPAPQQDELFSWAEFLAQVPAQSKRQRKQPPASLPLFEWVVAQEQEAALVNTGR